MSDPELIFHDTVPLPEEHLWDAREKAKKQKDVILDFFKLHSDRNFTPIEVYEQFLDFEYPFVLLTSVRRSISDLTKEGRLIKCDWSERRDEAYGKPNRTWRYNTEYIKPINPQK